MHVFVTGGTGYIGRAVVGELVGQGHRVTALVRSSAGEAQMREAGARVEYGDLRQAAAYSVAAIGQDALVHIARDWGEESEAADRVALSGLLDALQTSKRACVFIYTSHVWVLGETGQRWADESALPSAGSPVAWRLAHEKIVLEASSPTASAAVVRPGIVFGGRGGFIGQLFMTAEREGAAQYVGGGDNCWSLVHLADLARLYRMILEKRGRGVFHGVDGSAIPARTIAEAASRAAGRGGATQPRPRGAARPLLGEAADGLCLDQRVRATRSSHLGWRPRHPTFLESADAVYLEWRG